MSSVSSERMFPYAGNMNHWVVSLVIPLLPELTGESPQYWQQRDGEMLVLLKAIPTVSDFWGRHISNFLLCLINLLLGRLRVIIFPPLRWENVAMTPAGCLLSLWIIFVSYLPITTPGLSQSLFSVCQCLLPPPPGQSGADLCGCLGCSVCYSCFRVPGTSALVQGPVYQNKVCQSGFSLVLYL